jgi:hypothetical protein
MYETVEHHPQDALFIDDPLLFGSIMQFCRMPG